MARPRSSPCPPSVSASVSEALGSDGFPLSRERWKRDWSRGRTRCVHAVALSRGRRIPIGWPRLLSERSAFSATTRGRSLLSGLRFRRFGCTAADRANDASQQHNCTDARAETTSESARRSWPATRGRRRDRARHPGQRPRQPGATVPEMRMASAFPVRDRDARTSLCSGAVRGIRPGRSKRGFDR